MWDNLTYLLKYKSMRIVPQQNAYLLACESKIDIPHDMSGDVGN